MMNTEYLNDKSYKFKTDIAYMSQNVKDDEWLHVVDDLRDLCLAREWKGAVEESPDLWKNDKTAKYWGKRKVRSVYLRQDIDEKHFKPLRVTYKWGDEWRQMDVDFHDLTNCSLCATPACGCAKAAQEGKCYCFNLYHSLIKKPNWVFKVEKAD